MHLELVAVVVEEYDPAIDFYVNTLGFDLVGPAGPRLIQGRAAALWPAGCTAV